MIIKLKDLQNYLENKNDLYAEPTEIPIKKTQETEPTEVPQRIKSSNEKSPTEIPSKINSKKEPNITIEEIRNITIWEVVADLGNRFLATGNKEIARECYVQALELGANASWIYIKLADLVGYEESVSLLEKSWEIEKNEWYFLIIEKSKEKIKEIKNRILFTKERFHTIDSKTITNPYIFMLYLEEVKNEVNVKEKIDYFLKNLKNEYKELEIVENIKNFLDYTKEEIEASSFEDPNINESREEKLKKLKQWLKTK